MFGFKMVGHLVAILDSYLLVLTIQNLNIDKLVVSLDCFKEKGKNHEFFRQAKSSEFQWSGLIRMTMSHSNTVHLSSQVFR